MPSYKQLLEAARPYPFLSEETFAGYGGAFFAEELGLHVGQDASRDDDIGGIVPYGWQVEYCRNGTGDISVIERLFRDLGQGAQIDEAESGA